MFAAALLAATLLTVPTWDHPGYDAEDSYYNPAESVINASTIGSLKRQWSVPLRRSEASCSGPSAPLVAGGRVFATDEKGIVAYQAISGARLWTFDWADPGDASTPRMAVSGGVLVAANGDCNSASDPDGGVVALSVETGAVRWQMETDIPVNGVVVDKGIVVISGSSSSDEQVTMAYRTESGRLAWRKKDVEVSGVSAAGRILLTREGRTSAALITTGQTLWTKKATWTAEAATPAGDIFLATSGTAMVAVRAADGVALWSVAKGQSSLVATDGRRVYRASARTMEALDLNGGRQVWSRQLPAVVGQPVRAGGLLYTGGPVLSPTTGAVVDTMAALRGAHMVVGGLLFTVSGLTLTGFTP